MQYGWYLIVIFHNDVSLCFLGISWDKISVTKNNIPVLYNQWYHFPLQHKWMGTLYAGISQPVLSNGGHWATCSRYIRKLQLTRENHFVIFYRSSLCKNKQNLVWGLAHKTGVNDDPPGKWGCSPFTAP